MNSRLWESWPSKDIRREASILSVEKEMPDYGWGCDKQMNETGYWQKSIWLSMLIMKMERV